LADTRLKIAVFIDFDNIEIGVKSTLGTQFDIGVVLEALKERGEVVSKIAYGDWTRAGDYSRSLTQHATKLVQRNLTPGGDKNGADINLALDALEMAFTHGHINAYVIVGGDSDFITLVEKLKQYDKQVFVVGGRSFTSLVMQRNCHEFIAYENLTGSRRGADRRHAGPVTQAPIDQALPLLRRALKVLIDREVTPQLGLLKSTLLQLDSTFSERTYGVNSFRDFAQKMAAAGHVTLREHGRNVLVELRDGTAPAPAQETRHDRQERNERRDQVEAGESEPAASSAPVQEPRAADGVGEVRRIFQSAATPPRWPMYIRQAKQFMRNVDASFDERKFGFGNLVDLLRAAQREGLFRIERDRQGVVRLFPGPAMQSAAVPQPADDDNRGNVRGPHDAVSASWGESVRGPRDDEASASWGGNVVEPVVVTGGDETPIEQWSTEPTSIDAEREPEVVEAAAVQEMDVAPVVDAEELPQRAADTGKAGSRGRRTSRAGRGARGEEGRAPRKPQDAAGPRPRKPSAKPRTPRPPSSRQ
jgi:uncharacterized LabA/DUF88 family protein